MICSSIIFHFKLSIVDGNATLTIQRGLTPDFVAGHSLGEYTAATGVFDLLGCHGPLDELEQQLSQLLWAMLAK
jgi:hypothetical protein